MRVDPVPNDGALDDRTLDIAERAIASLCARAQSAGAPMSHTRLFPLVIAFTLVCTGIAPAQRPETPAFSPLGVSLLDGAAFAQWLEGKESPVPGEPPKGGPQAVVWTSTGKPEFRGVKFGEGREAGVRHLRIGFAQPVAVGSVLVRGGGTLSVLKPDAAYPGDLADDAQWQPAERLAGDAASRAEVGQWRLSRCGRCRRERRRARCVSAMCLRRAIARWRGGSAACGYCRSGWATWPRRRSRNRARATTPRRSWWTGSTTTGARGTMARQGAALPVSAEHPEVVTLTWPKPVRLDGLCLCGPAFAPWRWMPSPAEPMKMCAKRPPGNGGASRRSATWIRFIRCRSGRIGWRFPQPWRRARCVCGSPAARSPRTRTSPDKVKEGRRVWLGEVLALAPLKDAALTSLVLPKSGRGAAADPGEVHAAGSRARDARDRGHAESPRAKSGERDSISRRRKHRVVGWQRRPFARSRGGEARRLQHPHAAGRARQLQGPRTVAPAREAALRIQHLQRGQAGLDHG